MQSGHYYSDSLLDVFTTNLLIWDRFYPISFWEIIAKAPLFVCRCTKHKPFRLPISISSLSISPSKKEQEKFDKEYMASIKVQNNQLGVYYAWQTG